MICLIQRVTQARVDIAGKKVAEISPGLAVLCGFQPHDNNDSLQRMAHKLLHYRVFSDADDKMNRNLQQVGGDLLLVPQFTLSADTRKGLRPSFHTAAEPKTAQRLFTVFVEEVTRGYRPPQTGVFGADMQLSLTNDGPVTFWLEN